MTYCVGLKIDSGLVFMSDTRTNAGIDSISTFRKMHTWSTPDERVIVLLSAGNLATTQAVVSLLNERTKAPSKRNKPALLQTQSMFETARYVGSQYEDDLNRQRLPDALTFDAIAVVPLTRALSIEARVKRMPQL